MSDWKFFISLAKGYASYFRMPKVFIIETREDDNFLKAHKQAWAYYDPDTVRMFVLKDHNCLAVRLHEYGHWMNECIYFFLEVVWEFIWWGCGIRRLFAKEAINDRRDT